MPRPSQAFTPPAMTSAGITSRLSQLHAPVLTALRRGHHLLAGVDEAGAGPLAGPVVAASVLLNPYHPLPELAHLNDSKKLTPSRRAAIHDALRDSPAVSIAVSVVSAQEVDSLNILRARLAAMSRATRALPVLPNLLFVDGHLQLPDLPPRVLQKPIVKGDATISLVAMASVVAKHVRDGIMREFDQEFQGYGFAKHAGYPTKEHLARLKELGPCRIHRRSFRPVREAAESVI